MGRGAAGGAATIVNAFATGRGAAFGLGWQATARVRPGGAYAVTNGGRALRPPEDRLAVETARTLQAEVGLRGPLRIDVESAIPPKKGLKSSSAVGVAVARAVCDLASARLPDGDLLALVARAAIRSRTSLTGALDDAAACDLGGVVLTDNLRRRVLRRDRLPAALVALVRVPARSTATGRLRRSDFRAAAPLAAEAWRLAERRRYPQAMLVNTLAYAPLLGLRPRFTFDALAAGAWAAGLSGKGPAEVALVHRQDLPRLRRALAPCRTVPLRHGVAA